MEALAVHVGKAVGKIEEIEHAGHRFSRCPERRSFAEVGSGDTWKGDGVNLWTFARPGKKGFQFRSGRDAPAFPCFAGVLKRLVQPEATRLSGTLLHFGVPLHADRASFPGQPMFPARRLVPMQEKAGAMPRNTGRIGIEGKEK